MPELPEMQALAERLASALTGSILRQVSVLGFSGLKTVHPSPDQLLGRRLLVVGRRAKYLVLSFAEVLVADAPVADAPVADAPVADAPVAEALCTDARAGERPPILLGAPPVTLANGTRLVIHLSQAGRVDLEVPSKTTRPRGAAVRLVFAAGAAPPTAALVREYGTQRRVGWWVLGPGDEGPLAMLGPEPDEPAFEQAFVRGDSTRHLHTLLRDQHFVAGIGRGYADDALNRAQLSPFASLRSLDLPARRRLVQAVRAVLAEAVERERGRSGGLSEARLGDRFEVHGRVGQPCPRCGETLLRVSFDSHEIVYCRRCQTKGRALADRRLSRLLH